MSVMPLPLDRIVKTVEFTSVQQVVPCVLASAIVRRSSAPLIFLVVLGFVALDLLRGLMRPLGNILL